MAVQSFCGGLISRSIRQRRILLSGRCFCTAVAKLSAAQSELQYGRYFNPWDLTARVQAATFDSTSDAHLQGGARRSRMMPRSVPCLLVPSTSTSSSLQIRRFYDTTTTTDAAADGISLSTSSSIHEVRLPSSRSTVIGSSEGFLISLDQQTNQIHVVHPITGDHIPNIPPMPSIFDRMNSSIFKAILSPSLDTLIVFTHTASPISARIGPGATSSSSWSFLPSLLRLLDDFVFHKGLLHAINLQGALILHDINNKLLEAPLVVPDRDVGHTRWEGRYLVQSPDRTDLFLVVTSWLSNWPVSFSVFKLDTGGSYRWMQVGSIGEFALFLGSKLSASLLPVTNQSKVKPNHIYYTGIPPAYCATDTDMRGVIGAYDLEGGKTRLFEIIDSNMNKDSPSPLWFKQYLG